MKNYIRVVGLAVALLAGWGWGGDYLSPEYLALTPDGSQVYVTAQTAKRLLVVDGVSGGVVESWRLAVEPSGVVVGGEGAVFVTGGGSKGHLYKYDAGGKVRGRVAVGHTPMSPVVSPDGGVVYLVNRFDNMVVAVDAARMRVVGEAAALREPHAAALGRGGRLLFVANHLPYCRATDAVVSAAVSVIDTATMEVRDHIRLPNGSTGVRGAAASVDGSYIYVTHTLARFQLPTTQLERGWMNTAAMSIFDGESGGYVNTVLLDDIDLGAANPWGVGVTADDRYVVVAHAGTREVSIIEREGLHEQLERAAAGERVNEVTRGAGDVPNDLSFLAKIRRRVKLGLDGPRGVVASSERIWSACYFADALAVVPVDGVVAEGGVELVRLGPEPDMSGDRRRRGEMIWNDGTACFQQWQSCASCHPDGRMDGLNWDLLNDGIGNPKQTKNMVYSHLTPPTMVTGIRADMKTCNRTGFTHIQFAVVAEEDTLCVDEFVMSLKPEVSPWLEDGKLSRAARRGEKIFYSSGCAGCHPPAQAAGGERLFTDLKKHNLGHGVGSEAGRAFDTTTLVEVWRSAPYLYDGRALTMRELLTVCNPDDKHGRTTHLSTEELEELAAYILSY